jgi:ubiquilin
LLIHHKLPKYKYANTIQMGAPPSEDQMAQMLDDPNVRQSLNEALNNPAMIDMMIQQVPGLRDNPQARQMLESPEFRQMMTNPDTLRQAARMQRMMQGGSGGGAGGFPAPGVTDTTPGANAGANATPNPASPNPWLVGPGAGGAGANPFAALMGGPGLFGQTPAQTPPAAPGSAGQAAPSGNAGGATAANPFGSLFGGAGGNPFAGMPPPTPEQMQQAMAMMGMGGGAGAGGAGNLFGNFGGMGGAASPAPPADMRPPEEQYADQLRQLNDMGFFDFDRNVAALRRSGGSVQGAIEQLLS